MAGLVLKSGIGLAAIFAALFQLYFGELVWKFIAYGRVLQPISDFPYTCRRIDEPRLKGCEDIWMSEATRQLFFACADPSGRQHWSPVVQEFGWEGRSKIDAIIALDLDKPKGDSFVHRVLPLKGFTSRLAGDESRIYMNGISGVDGSDGKITIALTNYGPSVDPVTGKMLDQKKVGANATIEVFETGADATELSHVRTFASPHITVPNRPALAGAAVEDGFYVTNESKERAGFKASLAVMVPQGNVVFCDPKGCHEVARGLRFPNGIHKARDGLIYVPATGDATLTVYREVPGTGGGDAKRTLQQVGFLDLEGLPDNVFEDGNGDIFVAVFPKPVDALSISSDPYNYRPRSAVYRIIRKPSGEGGAGLTLTAEKVIEDRDKEVLPGTTTAAHDAKTGRLFLAGIATPFITVCDPK